MKLDKEKAFELALEFILQHFDLSDQDDEVVIDPATSKLIDKGWVVTYNSKLFLETGDFNKMLMGNKPVLVSEDSSVMFVDPSQL